MGALSAACVLRLAELSWQGHLHIDYVEIDERYVEALDQLMSDLHHELIDTGMHLTWVGHHADAIKWCIQTANTAGMFDYVVLNPPYGKLKATDPARTMLHQQRGIRAADMYGAFLSVACELVGDSGAMASLTPRSFANGKYFQDVRDQLIKHVHVRDVWLCETRDAFAQRDVLQEIVVIAWDQKPVQIVTVSAGDAPAVSVPASMIVAPPPLSWFRFPHSAHQLEALTAHDRLPATLHDLGIDISTGPIVVYRAKEQLKDEYEPGDTAFIEARHVSGGLLTWPLDSRSNALARAPMSGRWRFPQGNYVLVKRMSSKEERRRLQATLYREGDTPGDHVAFALSVNVLHAQGAGLPLPIAQALVAWLNSEQPDQALRSWNGSVNVNASDLRALRVPPQISSMVRST